MSNSGVDQADTTSSEDDFPVAAIICIAIGAYIVLIILILVIRQILLQRGVCKDCCGNCCGKEGAPVCCECCISCSESCNCCGSPDIESCLDAICPKRRQMDCADIVMCQCCTEEDQCCACCSGTEPLCDCGKCVITCDCYLPMCLLCASDQHCITGCMGALDQCNSDIQSGLLPTSNCCCCQISDRNAAIYRDSETAFSTSQALVSRAMTSQYFGHPGYPGTEEWTGTITSDSLMSICSREVATSMVNQRSSSLRAVVSPMSMYAPREYFIPASSATPLYGMGPRSLSLGMQPQVHFGPRQGQHLGRTAPLLQHVSIPPETAMESTGQSLGRESTMASQTPRSLRRSTVPMRGQVMHTRERERENQAWE